MECRRRRYRLSYIKGKVATEATSVPADGLKPIEPGCAFPKLHGLPVYKQFGSLPSLRLVLRVKVNSERYVPLAIDYICAKLSRDPAPKHRLVPKLEPF